MLSQLTLSLLLLTPSIALTESDSDAVNERIPVRPTELEQHWGINCQGSWQKLLDTAAQAGPDGLCSAPGQLARQLQLCAFIYQAPGSENTSNCPDYRSASDALQHRPGPADCETLSAVLHSQAACGAQP